MKRPSQSIFCTLIIIALFHCSFVNNDWVLFKKNNYSILFPNKPGIDSTSNNTKIGLITVYNYMYETPENVTDSNFLYGLSATDYPAKYIMADNSTFLKGFFDGVVKGAVNGVNGKLLEEKDITYKSHPGKEIKIDYSNGTAIIIMKVILVKERLFAIQTIASPGKEVNANATRFYNSFNVE